MKNKRRPSRDKLPSAPISLGDAEWKMRKIRLEWTDLPKDLLRANVSCFINGKARKHAMVDVDMKGHYKLEIGDGWITGNLRSVKQSGRIPMKRKWSPDGSGRFRHRLLNAPIDTSQLRLGPPNALQVVQECAASKEGVCPCGRTEWIC